MIELEDKVSALEFFAAKESDEVMMCVPVRCGLKQADSLHINGLSMVAMKEKAVLPIGLPSLSAASYRLLSRLALLGKPLPVGELTALGLFDSYFLKIIVAD